MIVPFDLAGFRVNLKDSRGRGVSVIKNEDSVINPSGVVLASTSIKFPTNRGALGINDGNPVDVP